MELHPEDIFHIYNRGNNRQKVFFSEANYVFFLKKVRKHLSDKVDILAYCLMPNHFHLLMLTPNNFNNERFTKGYGTLLSSYTRAVNIQEGRTGSLFQQKSKAKELKSTTDQRVCLNYIHFNPVKAGLVNDMKKYRYSSYLEYLGRTDYPLIKKEVSCSLLDLPIEPKEFQKFSSEILPDNYLDLIF